MQLGLANFVVLADLPMWAAPVWTLSAGLLLGVLACALLWGIFQLAVPKFGTLIRESATDGLLQPVLYALLIPCAVAILAGPFVNWGDLTKELTSTVKDEPASVFFPQLGPDIRLMLGAGIAVLAVFAFYILLQVLAPKLAAVALTTTRGGLAQPLFLVCLGLGMFMLVAFIYVPYNTLGEDIKMLKDSGMTMVMVLSIILSLWLASVSIADEIEGRTALTLLSKPVGRRQFILGKYLGILGPVLILFMVLGGFFMVTVPYKLIHEIREGGVQAVTPELCRFEMVSVVPGLLLAFMETMTLAAISVAISTRLPMLANLLICSSVYVLGHLVPLLVNSAVGRFEIVQFVGVLIATVLPVLDHFNIQSSIAAGSQVPTAYLGWATLYCLCYSTFALLAALLFFEDRDLA